MNEIVVETHHLTKKYGSQLAVDRVDMTVRRGEVYGFLGPNGAGKTTTLRMLVGLVRPSGGRAAVLGGPPGTAGIGALIEGPGFYPYLSGRDNLRVMARYRTDLAKPDRAVDAALDLVGLITKASTTFRAYSLGMKQRLGVAASLLGGPDLVILDEPTNGLDPAGITDMRRLIADLAATGRTVLLSSHQLDEVQEICARVGVIVGGRLLTESTVAQLRGPGQLLVRAEPLDGALAVGMRIAGDHGVCVVDESERALRVDLPPSRAPELTRALVTAAVNVSEIRPVERSLTDVFFELTGARTAGVPPLAENLDHPARKATK